jgi:5-formyltetrahydrofolate cyclo-ligase
VKVEQAHVEKSVLRQKFKDIRRRFARGDGRMVAKALNANLQRFLRDFPDVQICLYKAMPHEAPCHVEPVENYFYPVLRGDDLEFRKPSHGKAFAANSLAIMEPIDGELLDPKKPTVVCCPAVAIDSLGVRLGLGKGYYDRFFAEQPHVLRVGVVFHVQFSMDPLPAESWDQALDWIVSEKMILRTSTRSSQSWI